MESEDDHDNQHFFYEDEVFRVSKAGKVSFGMVMENYEANLSEQDSDSDDNSTYAPIKKGELRISWHPSGKEEVVKDETVGLVDRSLMPGDVVRRMIKGKDTQRGYCREIRVDTAIQICGTPYVITNVSSERLTSIEQFSTDLAVCLDSWVGSTRLVNSRMILTSIDGSKLMWASLYSAPFEDYYTSKLRAYDDSTKMYYPGQTVICSLKALDAAEWITCTKEMSALRKKKHKEHKFTVQSVTMDSVIVRWQCKALSFENEGGHEGAHTQPKSVVEGEDLKRLKMLNLFEPCTVSIGDRYYFELTEEDEIINIVDWRRAQNRKFKELHKMKKLDDEKVDKKSLNLELNCMTENSDTKTQPSLSKTKVNTKVSLKKEEITELTETPLNIKKTESKDCNKSREKEIEAEWLSDTSCDTSCDTVASHSSSQSTDSMTLKKAQVLSTKLFKNRRLKRTRRKTPIPKPPKPGDRIVVDIISTKSEADVVWQDGSIENDISSVDLYPIHHLDDQEFFPGDFVIAGAEGSEPPCSREYGVIQNMDHQGRTAIVKWFRTYTSTQEPRPLFLSESEVSVYDLKDHPDFQYRPATIVIRVANFVGEDATCTAGQVIDNFPEGKVKVWWVDGHSSMCWPQDIFKIGEYDSDDGDFWGDNETEDSWETMSGDSLTVSGSSSSVVPAKLAWPELKPRLSANVERARTAMARLEEIFTQNPSLQSQEVMKKLLDVYKECRYLDRLMDTSFFHEDNFEGLLERVREKGTPSAAKQIKDHLSRLFSNDIGDNSHGDLNLSASNEEVLIGSTDLESSPLSSKTESRHRLESKSSSKTNLLAKDDWLKRRSSTKSVARTSSNSDIAQKNSKATISENNSKNEMNRTGSKCDIPPVPNNSMNNVKIQDIDLKSSLDTVKMVIEKIESEDNQKQVDDILKRNQEVPPVTKKQNTTVEGTVVLHSTSPNALDTSQTKTEDSGLYSHSARASMGSSESYQSSTEYLVSDIVGTLANQVLDSVETHLEGKIMEHVVSTEHTPSRKHSQDEHNSLIVCAKLCSLIKKQLVAAHAEILRRFGVSTPSLTDIVTEGNNDEDPVPEPKMLITNEIPGTPMSPTSVSDVSFGKIAEDAADQFAICDTAPCSHNYYLTMLQPTNPQEFFKTVRKELKLLRTGLPPGVWVKNYEDRLDLFSVLIRGPNNTPYEDGLFLFDFQLPAEYPRTPPLCHYISYCSDRLNPNLYEDGKVCVSLLGTWSGKGTEVWGASSTLLQVFVSIQGLILVPEPYFNEAGYEKQKGSQAGCENSRMYNEMVVLKLVQATTKLIRSPPEVFREEIMKHFKLKAPALLNRLENWLTLSEVHNAKYPTSPMTPSTYRIKAAEQDSTILDLVPPDFPLIPASRGFCLSLRSALVSFKEILNGLT